MSSRHEVIIIGLGAMGSAAAFHLAKRGRRVLGLDRFHPPHDRGSSHGRSRIIRQAYFEHPSYVPLLGRAYELWGQLGDETQKQLLRITGGLMIGAPQSSVVEGAARSAREHHLEHELLSAAEVRKRYPVLSPPDEMMAVWEPRAGVLSPEDCVAAHLELAQQHGAELRFGATVLEWKATADSVQVKTSSASYEAERVVFAAGPWIASLLDGDRSSLESAQFSVERQVMYWFDPIRSHDAFERCPIHIWEYEPGRHFYGFPNLGSGVKVARHHEGEATSAETVRREVSAEEIATMRGLVDRFLPDAGGPLRSSTVCLYTNTPDGHFLIDFHPEHPRVLVASPCSGHGFKFASVVGEIVADLIEDCPLAFDLSLFRRRD